MIEEKKQEQEEQMLAIRDQEGNETFKIGPKGEVFWFDPESGDFKQAKTDADLGKAMALVIMQLAGMDYVRLIEVYLGESVRSFKSLLLKKISETTSKSKSIKKGDLMKIISEFKI
jgi:hypothetical protein